MNIFDSTERKIEKLKLKAFACMKKKDYESVLQIITCIASIEYLYNQTYTDGMLEELLLEIGRKVIDTQEKKAYIPDPQTVLFYDGFGLDTRGLALIYLQALSINGYHILYLSNEKNLENIKETKKLIKNTNGSMIGIPDKMTNIEKIRFIYETIRGQSVSKAFFYTTPSDVPGVVAFNSLPDSIIRYQINLTDHAFWLGKNAFDYCIEFRNYGASISCFKRNIDSKKILLQPYYPVISENIYFKGFPFRKEKGDFVIFSGGALYKTDGGNNWYFKAIREILSRHKNIKFWYAGYGESREMDKLLEDYPGQAFYTAEREDLFQILLNCDIYLNTYPVAGGLMTQYAAKAGIVPLTIRTGAHASELIFGQEKCGIDFDTVEDLLDEFERIFADPVYKKNRESQLINAVLSENEFNNNLKLILEQNRSRYSLELSEVDDKDFIGSYKEKYSKYDVESSVGSLSYKGFLRVMPFYYSLSLIKKFVGGGGVQESLSVYFAIYNPVWEKLKKSLISVLEQKHISFEIIISDDGSENNCFEKVLDLFKLYGFTNFKLLPSNKNRGTVINVYRALSSANGIYVRGLSPGDLLPKATHLSEWFNWCIRDGILYSFGDIINYNDENGFREQKMDNNPKNKWLYKRTLSNTAIRTDYLILSDYISGAAPMFNREFSLQYIEEIAGKIKYAEDNIIRLMQFDGVYLSYYPKIVELYEYGTGISTSQNEKWSFLLSEDRRKTNDIILSRKAENKFQHKCKQFFREEKKAVSWKYRLIKYFRFRWAVLLRIISMVRPEKTKLCTKEIIEFYEMIMNKCNEINT